MTEEDQTKEDEVQEAAEGEDDLPSLSLPSGLVTALADAGIQTEEDWKAIPLVKMKWPKSLGAPPEGADVELVDG